jgi:hypothetical protein
MGCFFCINAHCSLVEVRDQDSVIANSAQVLCLVLDFLCDPPPAVRNHCFCSSSSVFNQFKVKETLQILLGI